MKSYDAAAHSMPQNVVPLGAANGDRAEELPVELQMSRGEVSLCFLLNGRSRSMRVIDFRAGSQPEKLELVLEVAEKYGMRRAFAVVEREEASAWCRLGFQKEGTIPGFYKRSDGHILALDIDATAVRESTTRIRVDSKARTGTDRAERAYQAGRRLVKARGDAGLPKVKVAQTRPQDEEKAMSVAVKAGRDMTDFTSFGRDKDRSSYLLTARGGFSVLVGVELQPCFDNAYLELLTGPRGDKELWMIAGGLSQLSQKLQNEGVVSLFATTPSESPEMNAIMVAAGFRKTGKLQEHLMVEGRPVDAHLWSCKLSEPA